MCYTSTTLAGDSLPRSRMTRCWSSCYPVTRGILSVCGGAATGLRGIHICDGVVERIEWVAADSRTRARMPTLPRRPPTAFTEPNASHLLRLRLRPSRAPAGPNCDVGYALVGERVASCTNQDCDWSPITTRPIPPRTFPHWSAIHRWPHRPCARRLTGAG